MGARDCLYRVMSHCSVLEVAHDLGVERASAAGRSARSRDPFSYRTFRYHWTRRFGTYTRLSVEHIQSHSWRVPVDLLKGTGCTRSFAPESKTG